ncbi:putative ars binding protein [Phaeomoniella chlamydospora]|uniref:Putative ars binding protein n=1 Tax=Phaeomoniella chlamydospora TaxID=158046 RepID=A0A0G2E534_PHACM|nr:putative ars binding protein [Phaeomoniella chlamydospora]
MHKSQNPSGGRKLPSRSVSRDSIVDAYVAFILYANPSIPISTNTSELRKIFGLPPRNDGKTFDTFKLWELIQRMDKGELKTWVNLATELGVDPPSTEQSSQKIQQYAVRLKRWMHAMHIDAFFKYLLGKDHIYFNRIPSITNEGTYEPRDDVPPEEDLAIRALLPTWKPKRGRKKASGKEDTDIEDHRPAKRPHIEISPAMLEYQGLESASMFPQGDMTWSAFPEDPEAQDPWGHAGLAISGAAAPSHSGHMGNSLATNRWQRGVSPSAYPQSAIEPSFNIEQAFDIPEPRSAVDNNSSGKLGRGRKNRNAMALSSAWNYAGISSSSSARARKARGRRPANQYDSDGSFTTFSVNESQKHHSSFGSQNGRPPSRPPSVTGSVKSVQLHTPTPQSGRPTKLQLQVPQHQGGPIRLATPPSVIINGPSALVSSSTNQSGRASADFFRTPDGVETIPDTNESEHPQGQEEHLPMFDLTIDDVIHAFAARILRGKITGRPAGSMTLEEATLIATKALEQLHHDWPADISSDAFVVRCGTLLGLSADLGLGSGTAGIVSVKSMPQPLEGHQQRRARANRTQDRGAVEYVLNFDVIYANAISSSVQIHNIFVPLHVYPENFEEELEALRAAITEGHSMNSADGVSKNQLPDEKSWRDKYLELQNEIKRKDEIIRKMRRRVFEVVMSSS